MGRAAGKVETMEAMLEQLTLEAVKLSKQKGSGKTMPREAKRHAADSLLRDVQVAKPIEAHRLQFSGRPGFSPVPFLDSTTRAMYECPQKFSVPPEESQEKPPRVSVRGPRSEILTLLRALDASGRLAIFPQEEVNVSHSAGLFALMKNLTTDRLIMDSRPANLLEPAFSRWTQTMGSIVPLFQLHLRADERLVISGEDLRDFYYHFVITPERAKRNVLKFALSPEEASRFAAFSGVNKESKVYYPALQTMAMGDVNSVEFGQQAHVQLALALGLKLADFITLRSAIPRQRWFVGIMIDDFIVGEKVTDDSEHPLVSTQVADAMVDTYESVKLQAHDGKRMRELTHTNFWGANVDGISGLVRAQLERTIPICFITSQLCRLGWANKKVLEIVAGAWVSILQYRRRAMCLIEHIFYDITSHDYDEIFELSAAAVGELWSLVGLSPLICARTYERLQPPSWQW